MVPTGPVQSTANRSTEAPPGRSLQTTVQNKSAQVKVKVLDPNRVTPAGSGTKAPGQTQKKIFPNIRYHPTIITQGGEGGRDGGRAKTTSPAQKSRSNAVNRPQTGKKSTVNKHQGNHDADSSMRPPISPTSNVPSPPNTTTNCGNQTPVQNPIQRSLGNRQGHAADTSPPLRPEPTADQSPLARDTIPLLAPASPRPEEVPLGIGVKLDRSVVEKVEVQTRGQSENPAWFAWRHNRITASTAHRIAHSRFVNRRSKTPPRSYLATITGEAPNFHTRAMSWGITREAQAVHTYQKMKSRLLGRDVEVQECGLFIDSHRPWLAASPDGIVTDRKTGQRLLCLEVKCPYKHRNNTVEEACREDRTFCLEIQEERDTREQKTGKPPQYRLKPGHSYYTQIQCQLAVTGLQQSDLVVFTLKETAIVLVTFDPDFWEETLAKLELFYRDGLLPYLRDKRQSAVPAGRPED
ncbi:uncharacterized protein ACJ7VT_003029 [Polymixia lowei]